MTMQFGFYPGHENGCGHPRDCPHLGGASVGHLVHIVNSHGKPGMGNRGQAASRLSLSDQVNTIDFF